MLIKSLTEEEAQQVAKENEVVVFENADNEADNQDFEKTMFEEVFVVDLSDDESENSEKKDVVTEEIGTAIATNEAANDKSTSLDEVSDDTATEKHDTEV